MKLIFLSALLYCTFPKKAFCQQHQYGNMYLLYHIDSGSYMNIDQEIIPLQLAKGTYWALNFGFNEISDGGYIGIQTGYDDVSSGLLIFSIWNATVASIGDTNSYVVDFDGEGTGKSCRINMPIKTNHTYRLRILQLESNASGTFWGAWITDKTIGQEYFLGKIKTNQQTTLSSEILNFVEYFGGIKPCDDVPKSQVQFNSIHLNCGDFSLACKASYNPFAYKFARCIGGTCALNESNSLVIFGGNESK